MSVEERAAMALPEWNRRQFGLFAGAAALSASAACAPRAPPQAEPAATAPKVLTRLGIQLFTVRDSFSADPLATLRTVAEAGFAEVEFGGGGYFARDPSALRGMLEETGLVAPAMHCSAEELTGQMDRVITMAKTVGSRHVVLPWVSPEMRGSRAAWERVAALCTNAAQRLAQEGIGFAYHNHEFEFAPVDGTMSGLDILAAETDPDLVKLELDYFWAVAAKQDVSALIDRHAGRISLCHVKDMAADGKMILPGEGSIDYRPILKQSAKAGLEHFFVEDDRLRVADAERLKAASMHLLGMEIA